jgi:outer membrane protein insertion porin family
MQKIRSNLPAWIQRIHGFVPDNSTISKLSLAAVLLLALPGCSGTKYLKDGDSFYSGSKIKFEIHGKVLRQTGVKSKLKEFLELKPNRVIFGSRPFVWIYFKTGNPSKKKGISNWIKKSFGSPPVLLKDATPSATAKTMNSQLYNMGFFTAQVSTSVKTTGKESVVTYTAILHPPFYIRNINYSALQDTGYAATFKSLRSEALIKPGQRFSIDRMQAEQVRIEEVMQNLGFYYFNKRYVYFKADTTAGHHQVDLDLTFAPKMPQKAIRVYKMEQVIVIPDYSLSDTTLQIRDTTRIDGFTYIDHHHFYRPEIITNTINLRPGSIYTKKNRMLSMGHLTSLGVFKFSNIKFSDSKKDSSGLNAALFLTPRLPNNIRIEPQMVSKSNNFVGPGIGITFTNRNFFRGAELFQLKLNVGYEVQISRGAQAGALSSLEVGTEARLTVPRFITPIRIRYGSRKFLPQTIFRLGYNLQQRVGYFQLNSFTASYGYTWKENAAKIHTFYPIDIDYVEVTNKSPAFLAILAPNPTLTRAFENQFIPSARYSFTYNSQLNITRTNVFTETPNPNKSTFYFNGNMEVAGNLLNAFQRGINPSDKDVHTIFGSPYSQYVRADVDLRFGHQLSPHDKIATRLIVGLGLPYGNSSILPYIKQFSIGGASSIRAFPARSLGPGTYNVRTDTSVKTTTYFIDQRGDMKLEGNFEYRFDLIKVVKGAFFLDAGNIWLLKNDPDRPGAKFDSKTFLDQIAVGSGFGLRVDLNFFVLRFDVGIPLRKPYLPENQRWVIDKIDFGSSAWRNDNLLLNIAIGYPF